MAVGGWTRKNVVRGGPWQVCCCCCRRCPMPAWLPCQPGFHAHVLCPPALSAGAELRDPPPAAPPAPHLLPLQAELEAVRAAALSAGAEAAVVCEHHGQGGPGAVGLGQAVVAACKKMSKGEFRFLYDLDLPIKVGWGGLWGVGFRVQVPVRPGPAY